MDTVIKNKVVIITGGAEGIGYEIANHFLEEGAKTLLLLDINEIKGEESVKKLKSKYGNEKIVFIKCDVTKDLEAVSKKIFDEYKFIDVLVNNAGITDELSARKTIELNCMAVIEWTMKFWEHMRKDKGGRGGTIINIGSVYSYAVDPYSVFYKASKFAVMGLSRSLGHLHNFEKFGVRVVIICPGFTVTTLTEKQSYWDEHAEDILKFGKELLKQSPQDVGKAAVHVFKVADSGSAWKIIGGVLKEIPLVAEGDELR